MTAFTLPADAHDLIRETYGYWQRIHPAPGCLPGRQHLDPLDIPHLLTHVWMMDIRDGDPPEFRYRVVGTTIDHSLGLNLTGKRIEETVPDFFTNPEVSAPYLAMLHDPQPSYRKGAPVFAHNRQFRLLECLLLPMARDGRRADMLFCMTLFHLPDGTITGPQT